MTEELELRHLRYFVALAGERHFGRAAATLHVTQPLISRQIRALEKLLGAPLLARTRPTVELTAAGNLLYDEAQRALQQVERTARAVQHAIRGKETIGIALEPCSSFHGFERIMRKLNHASPHLRFEVHQMPVSEHAHRLRSGQIDIAYGHRGEAAEGVEFALLSTERLMAGLPAKHRLLRRGALDLAPLADEPFVFWARCIAPSCHDYILETLKSAGVPVRIQHTAPDHGKLLDMVAAGLGWTVAPACARNARHSGVAFREIRGVRTQVDLGLSYLTTHRDPAVNAVIKTWKGMAAAA